MNSAILATYRITPTKMPDPRLAQPLNSKDRQAKVLRRFKRLMFYPRLFHAEMLLGENEMSQSLVREYVVPKSPKESGGCPSK